MEIKILQIKYNCLVFCEKISKISSVYEATLLGGREAATEAACSIKELFSNTQVEII